MAKASIFYPLMTRLPEDVVVVIKPAILSRQHRPGLAEWLFHSPVERLRQVDEGSRKRFPAASGSRPIKVADGTRDEWQFLVWKDTQIGPCQPPA